MALLLAGCSGSGYFAQRGRDFADCFVGAVSVGPEVSVDVQATDLAHVGVGLGYRIEGGFIGRKLGAAALWTTFLPFAPFMEDGLLYSRKLFEDSKGNWTADEVQNQSYLIPALPIEPTNPRSDLLHFFDFEVGAHALLGVRLGFRPGEFLDFLLGWATLDLAGDDSPRVEAEELPDQASP